MSGICRLLCGVGGVIGFAVCHSDHPFAPFSPMRGCSESQNSSNRSNCKLRGSDMSGGGQLKVLYKSFHKM